MFVLNACCLLFCGWLLLLFGFYKLSVIESFGYKGSMVAIVQVAA